MYPKMLVELLTFLVLSRVTLGEEAYEKCTSNDCSGKAACATIYQHRNFGGWYQCQILRDDNCKDLSQWWTYSGARVSGVDSHGTCVRFYDRPGCTGTSVEFTGSNGYLNEVNFEDQAYSMSTCERPASLNKDCVAKVLFSQRLEAEKVSEAVTDVLDIADQLASLAVSGFSLVIPGLDLFYSGIRFITGLFDREKTMEVMIDAKIEDALTLQAASQISAKIHVVNNRLRRILSPVTPAADRRIDLGLAIHTCEEVKKLFEDKHYSFVKNKVVSSPYLVSFSSVYLSVAKLGWELRPEMRPDLEEHMRELAQLNQLFLGEVKRQRKEMLVWDVFPRTALITTFHVVEDRATCLPWENRKADSKNRRKNCEFSICPKSNRFKCERCLKNYESTLNEKLDKFFQSIIKKLKEFP